MLDSCCQNKSCELEASLGRQSRILWIALGINSAMFGVEFAMGIIAGSTALLADSLDMLGDALVYVFSLYVVGLSTRWRASAALMKGIIMAGFGLMVLAEASFRFINPEVPEFRLMGITGGLALVANATCLWLLTHHRNDDLNMRSTWLCSRNDIFANLGVLFAATAVMATDSAWPDLAVGLLITGVFARSAIYVIRQALVELNHSPVDEILMDTARPLVMLNQTCAAGICPWGACHCSKKADAETQNRIISRSG